MLAALVVALAGALDWNPATIVPKLADCPPVPAASAVAALANDNRSRAGTLRDGVLTLRLVARTAAWRPDGPAGCALSVHAFAEEGGPVQVPGPLIRVTAGTPVHVIVRNALPTPIWLRGLQDRSPGTLDSVEVAPGASREFRFVATTPGAWYYWAGGVAAPVPVSNIDGQLVGALIVDPPGEAGDVAVDDRVLVLTRWTPNGTSANEGFQLNAFNGRSWPATERLTYPAGDSVHWHVINAADATHEMHLHGFYFRLEAKGFAIRDTLPLRLGPRMRVTAVLRPGEWMSIAWLPERPGNWLFHCHLVTHMAGAQRLDRMPAAPGTSTGDAGHEHDAPASGNHALDHMGGLVLGVEVQPSAAAGADGTPDPAVGPKIRALDVFASSSANRFGDQPGYGFVVQDGPRPPGADSIRIPGTPLLLTRGEPVRIAVHNRLAFPISVHWHGIELDSYYDGVGGFSGLGQRIAPMIAPADSFVVRFTPPRAGTFMYHVHGESGEELASGLYAPLIVLEPGTSFDPRTDRVFVLEDGGPGEGGPLFINGTAAPDTMEMVAGTTYRLRVIYITANDVVFTTLSGPGGPVTARTIAFDGHDVPIDQALARPLRQPAGPGHTLDFAFTPDAPGDYVLTIARTRTDLAPIEEIARRARGEDLTRGPVTTLPIRVRSP
jgi:manganese oxidase